AIEWRDEPMVLVCAPAHRLAGRDSMALEELNGERLVGFDEDLTIRHEIDRVLALHGVEPSVVMEFDNIETIKRAIEIDTGVGLLPEPTVLREVAAGTLSAVRLDTDELVRPLGIIHRRGKELTSTARRFIDLLQKEASTDDWSGKRLDAEQPAASGNGRASGRAEEGELVSAAAMSAGGAGTGGNGHAAQSRSMKAR
ncbi:MAG TPA: LysR family transcriptional regulator substrate-binding protein, partial [Lacipirellulaceae bacterium]|nr:LysR family transcriptional regulator substrate-binding protein [Lacipirellulaceae bacterium]